MSIQQALMGGTYVDKIDLFDANIVDLVANPLDAQAGYQLTSGGIVNENLGVAFNPIGTWIQAAANANLYEARLSAIIGTTPSGDLTATWLNLGTSRLWFITQTVGGTDNSEFLIEIRQASTGIVLASATITLTAEVF